MELAKLTARRQKDGVIEGQAELTGIYSDGSLTVSEQRGPSLPKDAGLQPDQPPCPAPTGGWPQGPAQENIDIDPLNAYSTAHPGAIVQVAMLRPSATQVLAYALTDGDPSVVAAAVASQYRGRLCVTKSTYSGAQIEAAQRALSLPANPGVVYMTEQGLIADGQVGMTVDAVQVTPALAVKAAQQISGLVTLSPWLAPKPH